MSPDEPVDEGEIMFVDSDRGMLNTKSGLTLNFTRDQCQRFDPAARNVVSIARIEGMQAFGLALVADAPPPMFSTPSIDTELVDKLSREAELEPRPASLTASALNASVSSIDWNGIFTDVDRTEPGLSAEALAQALADAQRPFDRSEIEELSSFEPSVDSIHNPLVAVGDRWPKSWLSFLTWSNGGEFMNGERAFHSMFSVAEVREYTSLYGIVQFLPGAIPFAMDGGASLYMFDTRHPPVNREFPVVFCPCSEVVDGWEGVVRLAESFLACCASDTDPNDHD